MLPPLGAAGASTNAASVNDYQACAAAIGSRCVADVVARKAAADERIRIMQQCRLLDKLGGLLDEACFMFRRMALRGLEPDIGTCRSTVCGPLSPCICSIIFIARNITYGKLGRTADALAMHARSTELGGDVTLDSALLSILGFNKKYAEACELWQQLLARQSTANAACGTMLKIHGDSGQYAKACELWQQMLVWLATDYM